MLAGKKIILGITGSIAAYKSILLLRQLTKAGAEVQVICTPAARDFVPVLTLSTLSRKPVLMEMSAGDQWSDHVGLGRWADLMIIAPASCNTLAAMANGICNNLLLAVYLSATCPVWLAPAMDEDMWKHPATRRNLKTLESDGNHVLPVGMGELGSGLTGEGRMLEPDEIMLALQIYFEQRAPLKNIPVLVTAGPTQEPIDAVRFIGNHSSGKMGWELALALQQAGAKVTLVTGPVSLPDPGNGITIIRVQTAEEMHQAVTKIFPKTRLAVLAAAVADFTPVKTVAGKWKKEKGVPEISLKPTVDILAGLGKTKKKNQVLVGFALESNSGEEEARSKLIRKNADMVVLNSLQDAGAGFGGNTNKVTIFTRNGANFRFELKSKAAVARDIVETLIGLYYA